MNEVDRKERMKYLRKEIFQLREERRELLDEQQAYRRELNKLKENK